MDVNYKIIDTQRIIDYITSFPKGVFVEEIIQNSGAEKLRVYRLTRKTLCLPKDH